MNQLAHLPLQLVVLAAGLCPHVAGQTLEANRLARQRTADRIHGTSTRLIFHNSVEESSYREEKAALTLQVHEDVDAYITQSVDPAHASRARLGSDLLELLGDHRLNPEYGGPPFAATALRDGATSALTA